MLFYHHFLSFQYPDPQSIFIFPPKSSDPEFDHHLLSFHSLIPYILTQIKTFEMHHLMKKLMTILGYLLNDHHQDQWLITMKIANLRKTMNWDGLGLKWIQVQQLHCILVFVSGFWILPEINLNTSLKLYLISACTLLWQKKLTDMHKGKYKKVSFIHNFFIPE